VSAKIAILTALAACGGDGHENHNTCVMTLTGGMTGTFDTDCMLSAFSTVGAGSDGGDETLFGPQRIGGAGSEPNIQFLAVPHEPNGPWTAGHYERQQLSSWDGRIYFNDQPGWSTNYDSMYQPIPIGSLEFDLTSVSSDGSDAEYADYLVHGTADATYVADKTGTLPDIHMHVDF
jgi:hypothetical protein